MFFRVATRIVNAMFSRGISIGIEDLDTEVVALFETCV